MASALAAGELAGVVALARESIRHGLEHRRPAAVTRAEGALAEAGACFVSLHLDGDLRGCIGQTQRARTLGEQVVENAFAAAFRDPRFPPLTRAELDRVAIEVHVLTPLEPLRFADLPSLHALLRPGEDGLQLEQRERLGVFLPIMWTQLPTPQRFVAHLLRKAGIADPVSLSASRFGARVFHE